MNKKTPAKTSKKITVTRPKLYGAAVCIGLVVLWYLVFVLFTVFAYGFLSQMSDYQSNYAVFAMLFQGLLVPIMPSLIVFPFAVWIFKRVNLGRPLIGGICISLAPLFALAVFSGIANYLVGPTNTLYGNTAFMLLIMTVAAFFSAALYLWLYLKGPGIFSRWWVVIIAAAAPVALIILMELPYLISLG